MAMAAVPRAVIGGKGRGRARERHHGTVCDTARLSHAVVPVVAKGRGRPISNSTIVGGEVHGGGEGGSRGRGGEGLSRGALKRRELLRKCMLLVSVFTTTATGTVGEGREGRGKDDRNFLWGNRSGAAFAGVFGSDYPLEEYERTAQDLISNLRVSFEAERKGETEANVRRKGDPVKALVQRLISRDAERDGRGEQKSFAAIKDVIREIGSFYQREGPRAQMPDSFRSEILTKLDSIESLIQAHE